MIELLIIAAAVYGARQAWFNGTRAASRALGGYYEKTRSKLAGKPAFSWFGDSGPRVAAGLATATYGSVLAPRAFFRDWKVNWREGVERAHARYGLTPSATENEKREPTVLGAAETSENGTSENPVAETERASEKTDPLAQFNENLDAATEKFKEGGFSGEGPSEKAAPEPQREVPSLTPEEAEEMRFLAQGQGRSHVYVTENDDEPETTSDWVAKGDTEQDREMRQDVVTAFANIQRKDQSMSTTGEALNLESLKANVDTLSQYVTTESDAAKTNVTAYEDLVTKLENISGQLKGLNAENVAAHIQAAQEGLQVADAGAQQINTGLDNARSAIAQLEQDCVSHQQVQDAHRAVEDSSVDASFYAAS